MSRTNQVKEILAEVLKGRENELDVQAKGEGKIQVFFSMAYWNDPIQVEVVNKLNAQGIALETWNVAGTHFGQVHVRLELLDVGALLKASPELDGLQVVGWTNADILEKYAHLPTEATAGSRCKFPEVRKLAGCEDCPAWSRCTEEKVRY